MNGEDTIMVAVIGGSFLFAFALAFFFGKRQSKIGLASISTFWTAFTAITFFGMNNADGWDALGYLLFLLGVSAPAGVGGLIGGLVGWAKSGNDNNGQSSGSAGQTDTATIPR